MIHYLLLYDRFPDIIWVMEADKQIVGFRVSCAVNEKEDYGMKQNIFVGLLAFAILMLCGPFLCAYAEDDILFREIPWGFTTEEVEALLRQDFGEDIQIGISYESPAVTMTVSVPGLTVAGIPVKSCDTINDTSSDFTLELTTSDTDNVVLRFLPKLSEDGQSYSTEEAVLISAGYSFLDPSDILTPWAMWDELASKLDALYGEHKEFPYTIKRQLWRYEDKGRSGLGPVPVDGKVVNIHAQTYIWGTMERGTVHMSPVYAGFNAQSLQGVRLYFSAPGDTFDTEEAIRSIDEQNAEAAAEEAQKKLESEARGNDGL